MQDAFFTTVITLMVGGTAAINQAQAAGVEKISKKAQAATFRSYKVKGVRYHPLSHANNFSQTGKASWYGPGFHGKKTSNGESYNMHGLTAAHKTLPMGTLVRVSNLDNGKSVVVRINDRGPFHGNRIIDLSKGAASKLGFVHKGMANVRVEHIRNKPTVNLVKANATAAKRASLDNNKDKTASYVEKATKNPKNQMAALSQKPIVVPVPTGISSKVVAKPDHWVYLDVQKFANASDASLFMLQAVDKMDQVQLNYPMTVEKAQGSYQVRIGPFQKPEQVEELKQRLPQLALGNI